MEQEIVKEGVALAEKEAREKQVETVKKIVQKTLEKIDELNKRIDELQEERKILKMDLEDLKDGKLGRIQERQVKDEKARQTSVVIIEREVIRDHSYPVPYPVPYPVYPKNPWYDLWTAKWNTVYFSAGTSPMGGTAVGSSISNAMGGSGPLTAGSAGMLINCSVAKDAAPGAYDVEGHVVNFR